MKGFEAIEESEVKPNPLKREHLAEGIKPIMTCVGTEEEYGEEIERIKKEFEDTASKVDYYADNDPEKHEGWFTKVDRSGYKISTIDGSNKFTDKLHDCTSVIAVGTDLETGKNVSFLTHEDSYNTRVGPFQEHLETRLQELKDKCREGTIDVVVAGGQLVPRNIEAMYYRETLNTLNPLINKILGFEPVVASGPKEPKSNYSYDDVYFDTENRRLYVVRPKDHVTYNDSFIAGDINEMNKKWIKDQEDKRDSKER